MATFKYRESKDSPWKELPVIGGVKIVTEGANKIPGIADGSITELASTDLEGATAIRQYVFANCKKLEKVSLPNTLQSIGDNAFQNCKALKQIEIPNSVVSIGKSAFSSCTAAESVSIPESVKTIGSYAFASTKLREATIPNSVTSLGTYAFQSDSQLRKIVFGNGITTIPNSICASCVSISHIIIPEGITKIDNYAFQNCGSNYLWRTYFPSTLTEFGTYAFYNTTIRYVILPKSVKTIKNYAFYGRVNLLDLTDYGEDTPFPTIESNAFSFAKLNSVEPKILVPVGRLEELSAMTNWSKHAQYMVETNTPFTEAVTYTLQSDGTYFISGIGTFCGTELIIPDTYEGIPVTGITKDAFYLSYLIERVVISNNITKIGYNGFRQCTRLEDVVLPSNVTQLEQSCFQDCAIKHIDLPSTVTKIDSSAFSGCDLRGEFVFPPKVTSVSSNLFQNNYNLKGVVFTPSISRVWSAIFYDCWGLEYVDMTSYINGAPFPSLSDVNAFTNTGKNTEKGTFEIRVPAGRKAELAAMTNWSTYADNIVEVGAEPEQPEEPELTPTEGLAYELQNDGTYWITGKGTATSTDIITPLEYNGVAVTGIKSNSFKSGITSIIMQDSIKTLGQAAFAYNSNGNNELKTVVLSKSITEIPSYCFQRTSIDEIELHEGIINLNAWCFGNTKLKSITLPSTLKNNGNTNQFENCNYLKTIVVKSSFVASYMFNGCSAVEVIDLTYYEGNKNFPSLTGTFAAFPENFKIRVPAGRKSELAAMTNWSTYADNIVEV